MNPVIPGDHPDCTLTKIGNDFYTTGSSFNPTPVIYHSTDLVHWEAVAQPVSAAWTSYGDKPGGGCWGGQLVFRNNKFWHFFFKGTMYFTTASNIQGPWSTPTAMVCPASVPGLGYDNSIFTDNTNKWYLVVKNGQVNNWVVELGENGQPTGAILNLCWINPAPSYPYSWAEGPVMWKYNGYYYYSFARDVSGGQKVMRSDTLTDDQTKWTMLGDLFNLNDPKKSQAMFGTPNHTSAPEMLTDSTHWVIHPVYYSYGNDWRAQGRQGLLNQLRYNALNVPLADYPINEPYSAPNLPCNGIPWMVPKSDFFGNSTLNPEWSFMGYTPTSTWSLTQRSGWLKLTPRSVKTNYIVKNDGEHNYTLITRVDFKALAATDEAGIRLAAASDTVFVKVYSSLNTSGFKIFGFTYYKTTYQVANTIGDTVFLKLNRANHIISGYYSKNGIDWLQIGSNVDITEMDSKLDMSGWSGQRQGLYVAGTQTAYFDFYIYRDAYSAMPAETPANMFGVTKATGYLYNIHNNDWAMYAGVEFQNKEYGKIADYVQFSASTTNSGFIEVWLDSIDTGTKIGTCKIESTGSFLIYKTFTAKVQDVTGRHDVYLKFTGTDNTNLFQLKSMIFTIKSGPKYISSATASDSSLTVSLDQNIVLPISTNGFKVTINDSINAEISSITTLLSDSVLLLKLKNQLLPGYKLQISYNGSWLKNSEGLDLVAFTNKSISNTLTLVQNLENNNSLKIYPNPSNNHFMVSSEVKFNTLLVYNSKGQLQLKKYFKNEIISATLNTKLPKGIYLVKISNSQLSKTLTSKLVIE